MSVYRSFDRAPANDVHYVRRKRGEPDPVETPSQADWTRATEAALATGSLKAVFEWVESLPANVQPRELILRFPRIAKTLWALWNEPASFNKYIEVLLTERRDTNRLGFPEGVLRELFLLRDYYVTLNPGVDCSGSMTTRSGEEPE